MHLRQLSMSLNRSSMYHSCLVAFALVLL
nr:L protein of photosystem II [Polulichloris maxima]WDY13263.1 L protein of photosystem II [Polulichloris maxima]